MRSKRLIRFRRRRKTGEAGELDITSLLDILVILLVFLLKSYSTSGLIYTPPEQIQLPVSTSKSKGSMSIMIQVSKDKIWVDEKIVFDQDLGTLKIDDGDQKTIISLFNELTKKREEVEMLSKTSTEANKFSGIVNLVIDKSINYKIIKNILFTAAEAGFVKYKFIVMGDQ